MWVADDAAPAERVRVAEHLIVLEVMPPRSPRSREFAA